MSTHIGIGFSRHPDPEQAFKEAAIEVKQQTNLPSVDLALAFFTSGYAQQNAIDAMRRILQPVRLAGSTAPALIVRDHDEPFGVLILGIVSEEMTFGASLLSHPSFLNLREAGFQIGRNTLLDSNTPHRQGFLAIMSGLQANNTPLLLGLQESLGRATTFSGGICCDEKLGLGVLLHQNTLTSDGILGLLIGGAVPIAIGARHGWKPLGKPRIVDAADGNLIKQIDRKPAVFLYQEYFGDELKDLEQGSLGNIGLIYPMGFSADRPKEYLLRHPIRVLPDGSIVCQAEITVGSRVHLMIADKDACRHAAYDAAIEVRDQLFGRVPKLLIVLESLARRQLFGRAAAKELAIIKEILGFTVPLCGMYTYGELAPMGTNKEQWTTQLQNANIVIIAMG